MITWLMQALAAGVLILRVTPAGSFPRPLTKDEEARYVALAAQGDREARDKLVEHNLRLVAHIVKKYYARDDQEDLISIGTVGLIKAVCSYRGDKGVRLATYAARCIENEILMYFRSLKRQAVEVSLSEPIESERDGGALQLMDVLAAEDTLQEDLEKKDERRKLYRFLLSSLTPREREIVTLRYGLGGREPLTQREIAREQGISRSYVSQPRYCKSLLLRFFQTWETKLYYHLFVLCQLNTFNQADEQFSIHLCCL